MPEELSEAQVDDFQHRLFCWHQQGQVRTLTPMVFVHFKVALSSTTRGRLQDTELHILQQSQDFVRAKASHQDKDTTTLMFAS